MVKAVVFDLDATLVDSADAHIEAWIEAAKRIGLKSVGKEAVRKHFGKTSYEIAYALLVEHGGDASKAGKMAEEKDRLFAAEYASHVKPMPDARYTLSRLKELGVAIAVVSSNPRDIILKMLRAVGLADMVDAVVGQDEVCEGKPSPEPVLKAMERLGAEPGEALVVGDSIYDVRAGKSAGAVTVAVATGMMSVEELKEADYVFRRLSDILTILEGGKQQ